MFKTTDGRLAILDFGLMTQIDSNIKYGMIEAISHLIHRDYEAIVEDFVTLDFIPKGLGLRPCPPSTGLNTSHLQGPCCPFGLPHPPAIAALPWCAQHPSKWHALLERLFQPCPV